MCSSDDVIFTRAELRGRGVGRRELQHLVECGELTRLHRGVYATRDACEPMRTAVAHGGVPACVTAARHHGLWVLDETVDPHVWVPEHGHTSLPHRSGCACTLHWSSGDQHPPFTAAPVRLALLQILSCCGVEQFFVTLESALRLRQLSSADLRWLRQRVPHAGRRAMSLARRDADSGLESLVRWRLRRHRLRVRTQVTIPGVGRVDLVIGDRLIVEVDGRENHDGPSLRHRDLVRDARAATLRLRTLRFDYALVIHDWALVERAIIAQL